MEKSKLIALLRTFETGEIRQFKDFVASPYFNKNPDLLPFLDYLADCAPDFRTDDLEKERVYAHVFPGETYDAKQLAYLMNYLLKLAERFLTIRQYEEAPFASRYHLLKAFLGRRLDKHFNYCLRKTQSLLEEKRGSGKAYYYYASRIAELASSFELLQGRKSSGQFQRAADHADEWYFLNKLRLSCEMLNRQKVFSMEFELPFLDEVTAHLSRRPERPAIIDLFLHTYRTMENPAAEAHFDQLMELLTRHGAQIDHEELRILYLYAINYSVRNISQGRQDYISKALDLYLEGIRSRALFEDGFLTHSTFTNVIKLALMLNRYDWIEEFIERHHDFLPPASREDALHYILAELYYHRGDYDAVRDHLNQLQFSDIQYHLGSRVVLIKTYHALEEIESLLSLLAAFSVFLRRNKEIATPMKKRYLNFCNLLHRLLRRTPGKRMTLREQIRTAHPLAERNWLLEICGD